MLCKTEIKTGYITLRESCSLDVKLLAFHTGAKRPYGYRGYVGICAISCLLIYVKEYFDNLT